MTKQAKLYGVNFNGSIIQYASTQAKAKRCLMIHLYEDKLAGLSDSALYSIVSIDSDSVTLPKSFIA